MKRLTSLLFSVLVSLYLAIAGVVSPGMANDINSHLGAQVVNADFAHGEFQQQKYLKVLSLPLLSTGEFTYNKTQGLVWQTLTPMESRFEISTSEALSGADGDKLPNETPSQLLADIFLSFFSGDVQALESLFHIENKAGIENRLWRMELIPIASRLKKHIVNIEIEGDEYVETIKIHEASGDRTEISLQLLELN